MIKVVDTGMRQEGRAGCDPSLCFSRVMHCSLPTVGAHGVAAGSMDLKTKMIDQ